MATYKGQRRAIVLVIGFLVFVAVTILTFFTGTRVATLNIHLFAYLLPGFIFGIMWAEESWRWGLWLVAALWGVWVVALLFSDFYGIGFMKNVVPLCVSTLAACFGSYLGAKLSLRNPFSN